MAENINLSRPVTSAAPSGRDRPVPIGRLRAAAAVALALANGACALSFPMASLTNDDQPTGSIDRSVAAFGSDLDNEDLRRARAALAVALDPQGNGADVAWSNPRSGAKGSFVALAPPFPDKDRICRKFDARVSSAGGGARRLAGSACRDGNGEWTLRDTKPARAS